MRLTPFRLRHVSEGTYVHSFAPEGSPLSVMVRPEYIVDVRELVEGVGLPHRWDDAFLWVPAWLVSAIRVFMSAPRAGGLASFIRGVADGRGEFS